jgi:hypothetical protein
MTGEIGSQVPLEMRRCGRPEVETEEPPEIATAE